MPSLLASAVLAALLPLAAALQREEFSLAGKVFRVHLDEGGRPYFEDVLAGSVSWRDPRPMSSLSLLAVVGLPLVAFCAAMYARIQYLKTHAPEALHPVLKRKVRGTGAGDS